MIVLVPVRDPDASLGELIAGLRARGLRDVVVVDDGSGPAAAPALAALGDVTLLSHPRPLGKGRALKTGLAHALALGRDVVTVDGDGRHGPDDVLAVAQTLARHPGRLVVGARRPAAAAATPAQRLGNLVTRAILAAAAGVRLTDPVCGLRGLPAASLPALLDVPGEGCDWELAVLMTARRRGDAPVEVAIAGAPARCGRRRAFDPVRDSLALAFVFLRFLMSSVGCAALDVLLFALLTRAGLGLAAAVVAARAASSGLNFALNRGFVFRSRRPLAAAAAAYYLLVAAIAALSYALTRALAGAGLPLVAAKVTADSALFVASFVAQKQLVFGERARGALAPWLTPAGAALAVVCFFLPWARVSCLRQWEFTGLEVARLESSYWLVLAGEAAALAAWLLGRAGVLRRPRPVVLAAAGVALAALAAPLLGGRRLRGVDLELQAGAYGTVLGLIATLGGALARRSPRASSADRRRRGTDLPSSPPRSGSA